MAKLLPKLPSLLQNKIHKTGQTRSTNGHVIFQNRANSYIEKNKINKPNIIMVGLSFIVLSYILLLKNDKWHEILYVMFFMTLWCNVGISFFKLIYHDPVTQ